MPMYVRFQLAAGLLIGLVVSPVSAGDTLPAALKEVDALEQSARAVEPGDGHAVGRLVTRARSLLSRLEYAERFDRSAARTARQRVLLIGRALQSLDTPGNLPREIADPPKREKTPKAGGPPSASDTATERRLLEIRGRYISPIRALDAGERLGFTEKHAAILAQETVRFTDEFGAFVSQWQADKKAVRSMTTTNWTEGRRYQLDGDLIFSVPGTVNMQLWRSRWYLEAACDGALLKARQELGLEPVVIIHGSGRPAITWDGGATVAEMLQFAQHAARIGALFEQRIGGDPKPWQAKQQDIESLARSRAIRLN
jgi:hypothetical protein